MPHTIEKLWLETLKSRADEPFLQVMRADSKKARSLPFRWFFNKAKKLAVVLREDLELKEGATVAVLVDNPDDYATLLTAIWLAGLIALPIPSSATLDLQIEYITKSKAKAFVFPPTTSAKLAGLFKQLKSVNFWCVFGGGVKGQAVPGIVRLEELAQSQTDSFSKPPKIGLALPALKLRVESDDDLTSYFINFTQAQLIQSAIMSKDLFSDLTKDSLVWSSSNWYEFDAIIHNFIAPLLFPFKVLLNAEIEIPYFWDHVQADGISLALINQQDLRKIYRKAKLRTWNRPDGIRFFLKSDESLSADLIESFTERCEMEVRPYYENKLAGGVISVFPATNDSKFRDEWLCEYDVPSSGFPVSGVNVQVRDEDENIIPDEDVGEIVIKTTVASIFSKLPDAFAPGVLFTKDGYLKTGDEGYVIKDDDGNQHVFVLGKIAELIDRDGELISPGRVNNIVNSVKEVEHAEIVGFPNRFTGFEVGAFVVPFAASRINELELKTKLRVLLPWSECPKVIIFGSKKRNGEFPSKNEVLDQFNNYYDMSYVSPPKQPK